MPTKPQYSWLRSRKLNIVLGTLMSIFGVVFGGPALGLTAEAIEQLITIIAGLGGLFVGAHAYTDAKVTRKVIEAEARAAETEVRAASPRQSVAGEMQSFVEALAPVIEKILAPPPPLSDTRIRPPAPAEYPVVDENDDA